MNSSFRAVMLCWRGWDAADEPWLASTGLDCHLDPIILLWFCSCWELLLKKLQSNYMKVSSTAQVFFESFLAENCSRATAGKWLQFRAMLEMQNRNSSENRACWSNMESIRHVKRGAQPNHRLLSSPTSLQRKYSSHLYEGTSHLLRVVNWGVGVGLQERDYFYNGKPGNSTVPFYK